MYLSIKYCDANALARGRGACLLADGESFVALKKRIMLKDMFST